MKKIYFCLFIFLILISLANYSHAQKEIPSKDKVYLKNGSIKIGTVGFKEKKHPDSVTLTSLNNETISYTAFEVDSILLENNQKYIVRSLTAKTDSTYHGGQFVQVLFKGEFSLLKSKDKYFIELENGEILGPLQKKEATISSNKDRNTNSNNIIGLLSYLLSGECFLSLKDEIEKIQLKDSNLVELLKKYHECNRIEYAENINNQPKFRANWIVQAGIMKSNVKITSNSIPTSYKFENNFSPFFLIGKRLDLFKESPNLSMDILIGYSTYNNSINYRHETLVVNVSGESNYTNHSLSANWHMNHTFFKSKSIDLYIGAGAIYRLEFLKKDSETVEYEVIAEGVPIKRTSEVIEITPFTFSPSLKLGSILQKNNKSRLSVETRIDYTPNYMNLNLTRTVVFNSFNYGLFVNYSFLKNKN